MNRHRRAEIEVAALKARAEVEDKAGNKRIAKTIRTTVKAVDSKDAKTRGQAKAELRKRGMWK